MLDTAIGLVGPRLFMTALAPMVVFASAVGVLVITGVGWTESLIWWNSLAIELRIAAVVVVAIVMVVAAQLIIALRGVLFRFFEGYWGGSAFARYLSCRCRAFQLGVRSSGRGVYPLEAHRIMPTYLGNVLKAAEEHPRRYRIDAVLVWPRLYPTLPTAFTTQFVAAAAQLELAIVLSGLAVCFSVVGGVLSFIMLPWQSFPAVLVGGLIVAWLAYRSALGAARPYGNLVRAAYDVYRWRLLDEMGLQRPSSYMAELRQWEQLHKWWERGAPDTDGVALLGYPGVSQPHSSSAGPEELGERTVEVETCRPLRLGRWLVAFALIATAASMGARAFLSIG